MSKPKYPIVDQLLGEELLEQDGNLGEFAGLQEKVIQMMDEADAKEAEKVNRFDPDTLELVETLRGSVRKDPSAMQKARKVAERELGAGAGANWYHVLREDFDAYFEELIYNDDDFVHSVIQWNRGVKSTFHFAFCLKQFVRLAAARAFITTMGAHTDSLDRLAESLDSTRN